MDTHVCTLCMLKIYLPHLSNGGQFIRSVYTFFLECQNTTFDSHIINKGCIGQGELINPAGYGLWPAW